MKIAVCVKYVPDAAGERRFTDDLTVDRSGDGLLCELDEYAVEAAVQVAEANIGTTVTALCVGPPEAATAIRKALQMGADDAIHVSDPAVSGSDAPATALILAAVLADGGYDVVLTGMASTDSGGSVVPAMVAQHLGWPLLGSARTLTVADGAASVERDTATATQELRAQLPAVVSVTDQINEPRYPGFKQIMAAKKKPIDERDLAAVGVDAGTVGAVAAWSRVTGIQATPPRVTGVVITDEGDAGVKLVDFLVSRKLVS